MISFGCLFGCVCVLDCVRACVCVYACLVVYVCVFAFDCCVCLLVRAMVCLNVVLFGCVRMCVSLLD